MKLPLIGGACIEYRAGERLIERGEALIKFSRQRTVTLF